MSVRAWLVLLPLLFLAVPAAGGERAAAAALADVLFDMDLENLAYRVSADGEVTLSVGRSVPETVYAELVERLRRHPAVSAVRAQRAEHDFEPIR